ncbi:hypothetical protein ASPCADRAFT_8736 [Aspergillus carbonarius ITEM 5010]|uniref:Uncharacterized protein n=1 Tax=Aspergillus carbonarius (strain ITEM 5010) TaxID=602072 RepID=A0A1R3RDA7_ASPC5|nr:hypothetical protein ASPCADRAFT_8736 [Aspergillus carbonarius ITEM 5010]
MHIKAVPYEDSRNPQAQGPFDSTLGRNAHCQPSSMPAEWSYPSDVGKPANEVQGPLATQ